MNNTIIMKIKIADEVWIATALLHQQHPEEQDFSLEEIVARVSTESIADSVRPGVYVHVVQHCVANRPPNPGRYRMLYETRPGRRRLFRTGDSYHPAREGAKITPKPEEMPSGYDHLLQWYREWNLAASKNALGTDPLLILAVSGEAPSLWSDESADNYVRRLREGWE